MKNLVCMVAGHKDKVNFTVLGKEYAKCERCGDSTLTDDDNESKLNP